MGLSKKVVGFGLIIAILVGAGAAYLYFSESDSESGFVGSWRMVDGEENLSFKSNGDYCVTYGSEEVCWATWEEDGDAIIIKMNEENSYVKMQWKMDGDNLLLKIVEESANGEQQEVLDSPWMTLEPHDGSNTFTPHPNHNMTAPNMILLDADGNLSTNSTDELAVLLVLGDGEVSWDDVLITISIDNGTDYECANPGQSSTGYSCKLHWDGTNNTIIKGYNITILESDFDLCNGECWLSYDITVINSNRSSGSATSIQ